MDKALIRERTREALDRSYELEEFVRELQELLQSLADREATRNYQRIIPDTGRFYGVPKPILWIVASETGKFIERESEKAQRLLEAIWAEGSFEAKQIAGKSLEKFGPKNPRICLDFVSSALPDLDNWSVCDGLAMYGVRPIVYSNPELVLPLSEKWIKSCHKWTRRFGVVTLLGYKRVGATERVFELLDIVMEDGERDVRKAVSWILREITSQNPDEVAEFLIRWARAHPSRDARRVIADDMKKLAKHEQGTILDLLD